MNSTNSVELTDNENKSTLKPRFIKNIQSYLLKKLTTRNKKLILLITFGLVAIVTLYTENSNMIIQNGGDVAEMVDQGVGVVAYQLLASKEGFNIINFMISTLIPLILKVIGFIVSLASPFLMYMFFVYNMLYSMIKTMGTT